MCSFILVFLFVFITKTNWSSDHMFFLKKEVSFSPSSIIIIFLCVLKILEKAFFLIYIASYFFSFCGRPSTSSSKKTLVSFFILSIFSSSAIIKISLRAPVFSGRISLLLQEKKKSIIILNK